MAFPATYDFAYYQGDRYEFVVRPKQSNGDAFPLSGYTALFTVATERGNPSAVIGSSMSASVNTNLSTVTCVIQPSFGALLTGSSYIYDVQIKNLSSSAVYTVVTGTISITRDITETGSG
jgi:hypothetical protein